MKAKRQSGTARKTYGLSLNQQVMLDIQHLALDEDRYVNELVEEALRDLLKKHAARDKRAKAEGR